VLVTAPTHQAADNILQKCVDPSPSNLHKQTIRLGEMDQVDKYCHHFALRMHPPSLLSTIRLLKRYGKSKELTWPQVPSLAQSLARDLVCCGGMKDTVLVDEAG
jgi:hypothetical protein